METDERERQDPHEELVELVRQSMLLRFDGGAFPPATRLEMLQSIQRKTRRAARNLLTDLKDGEEDSWGSKTDAIGDLLVVNVAPPRAFFAFHGGGGGRMHLPLIDWTAFRGFTMALWINIDQLAAAKIEAGEATAASFELFRFTNASATLGVDASLAFDDQSGALLTVRSCAPHGAGNDPKRNNFGATVVAAIAPAAANAPSSDWRHITHRVQLRRRQWHLLVVSHSLHYVKKSRVTCYVDAQVQFSEELVYPSGLVQATKATIGGGANADVRLASATMYHEELPKSVVETMFLQGPSVCLFRRWMTVPSGTSVLHMVDLKDSTVLSPFSGPMEDAVARMAALSKLQAVFSFNAADGVNGQEDLYADRSVEWIAEGLSGSKAKWVSLENVNATSEIQLRNARLGKSVAKAVTAAGAVTTAWNRLLGVDAVPVLLDYVLAAVEVLSRESEILDDDVQTNLLHTTTENLFTDLLCILKGLLLNQSPNIHQALRNYSLHQFYHVIRRHPRATASALAPSNIVTCVDMVHGLLKMVPSSLIDGRHRNHPTQPSVWSWNPMFASAVRAWLLDYRVWATLSFKAQSIYNHQLYSLACEYPKLMNDLNTVPRLLETLRSFYASAPSATSHKKEKATDTSQNSKYSADAEKEQHWKQQCIHTIMETVEVCLLNQSVHIHEALEQEVMETTFARASAATTPGQSPAPAAAPTSGASESGDGGSAGSVAFTQRRKGGVFFINLENIIWSDQSSPSQATAPETRGHLNSEDKATDTSAASSALPNVQIRFSLLRDLRSIIRFIVACEDASVCTALLLLLRRLSVAYLDLRFGLVSSNVVDCVLLLLRSFSARQKPLRSRLQQQALARAAAAAEVRMACVPLLIYLLDWLESVEGRTVWCGLEEHLRSILNGEGNYTRGFLELMMEFYFDPMGLTGVQQSVVMNDPSKKDSVLFPISPVHGSKPQHSSMYDSGIVVMSDDALRSEGADGVSGGGSGGIGLGSWIKLATSFCGRKLSLSWEKRVQIVTMAALRSLTHPAGDAIVTSSPSQADRSPPRHSHQSSGSSDIVVTEVYDKGVSGILNLPLKSILPFLPALLVRTSTVVRDRVLMEISVKLKTDDAHQDHRILLMKKDWVEALLELCVVCSVGGEENQPLEDEILASTVGESERRTGHRAAAYSFDAHKTGEDLVVDAIVSLLCGAMQHPRGWRAFVDLIAALKIMQGKYSPQSTSDAAANASSSSIPAVLADCSRANEQLLLLADPLDWLGRITGIVIQKMARSRTILSKILTENVHKVMVLVQEALLSKPHLHCPPAAATDPQTTLQRASGHYVWSDAQMFLLGAVLDMCTRLVESTHKVYRTGLGPGLQVLQMSLSYVPSDGGALVERITQVMEKAFQQEMNTASAVRVFDHITPREVFLSALVCLRRALLVQQGRGPSGETDMCDALHLLVLKLCTSEVFLDDLHSHELTVHVLSDMSEENAVSAVLNALGTVMNEAEMHEREEEAEMVPLFPTARDLRRGDSLDDQADEAADMAELDPDPFAVAFAGSVAQTSKIVRAFEDNNERSLWAALEVEENRMLETLKEVSARELKRHQSVIEVVVPERDTWTRRLWDVQEFRFRSQHAHSVLSPSLASLILKEYARRVGLFEAPLPGRLRKPFDVDFPIVDEDIVPEIIPAELESKRRRFSLPLEAHCVSSSRMSSSKDMPDGVATTSDDDEGQLLLERVGRVVAAQRGGEIQDITSDGVVTLESTQPPGEGDESPNQDVDEPGSPTKSENEPHGEMDEDSDQQDEADAAAPTTVALATNAATTTSAALRAPALPSALWYVDMERHKENGLDPSEGVAIAPGEQILAQAKCRRVIPEGMVNGNLYFCAKVLVFVPVHSRGSKSEADEAPASSQNDEVAPGLRRCWRWKYKHIVAVFLRRFRLRDSALELFLRNGSTHFLDFPHVVKQQRNELARLLYSFLPRSVPKQWPGRASASSLSTTTKAWQSRQISNYEYLMALNTYAGRSSNDLTQYPVFPWVIRNFDSDSLDLSDPSNFRDLSKPMGALNPERLEEFWDRYHSFDDPVIPKFLYGSHYSTCAGVVLFFLVRMQPYADLHRKMQGGVFDLPDRLFYSIQETWNMCNSQMSEVKELTPEFYSDPSFLTNLNRYDFGKRHDQRVVEDVMLPRWAHGSPEEFVRLHRAALESEYVSQHLHEWVDLIFGFKQRGKAALKANNVFYYLTYYGVVDLDRIEDPFIRESMELQIAHFGQCPVQLFTSPHPKRTPTVRRVGLGVGAVVPPSVSLPAPGGLLTTPASSLASPGLRSPVAASPALVTSTNLNKPMSSMFQDVSVSVQEYRRHWSPTIPVKPLAASAVRWIKIFPDRFLTVNELGVVELYNWKLMPKPQPLPTAETMVDSISTGLAATPVVDAAAVVDTRGPGTPAPQGHEHQFATAEPPLLPISVRVASDDSVSTTTSIAEIDTDAVLVERADADAMAPSRPSCPWLLEVVRDDSPFDVVPRIPVFEDAAAADAQPASFFPITSSLNGRVLISAGAPNGSIQLRLLDLDNGHVVAKASVTAHDAAVTCLSVDRFSYHNTSFGNSASDGDEILVSGSKDMTVAVWRLSRTKPDMLFRPPRVSSCPIMVLRGHKASLVDCCVNAFLNVVVSCTAVEALVHFLHDDGTVAFSFRAEDVHAGGVFVTIAASSKGFIVALVRWRDAASLATSSACVVYSLAGVVVLKKVFDDETVTRFQLSAEGDLVILTLAERGLIRLCRLDDFVVVQEYETSPHSSAPICVSSFGPDEATFLAVTGHADGSMVLHLLPDADGSVSLLASLRRFLGVNSKLKMVKGTVQHAQNLAWTTLGNAKAVTSTARDIAGEAIGEAKSIVKGFITYLRQGPNT